jgi:DNA-binding GntR family transcriptional regulator
MPDMGKLDPDDPRPPYVQVADRYRRAIERGDFRPGDKLPAHHEVVEETGVSVGVVKRAYGVLQSDGLIVTRQGQGAFVRTRPVGAAEAARGDDLADIRATLANVERRLAAVERQLTDIES